MKIILIGYGTMGKLIERLAVEQGHDVALIVELGGGLSVSEGMSRTLDVKPSLTLRPPPSAIDVAIDFSVASAVRENVSACVAAGVPIVVGTTGWDAERAEIEQIVTDGSGAMVYGANFSIGVNLFYRLADYAAELIAKFPQYEAFIEEQHHSRKKDAPSGTALKLKGVVSKHIRVGEIAVTRAGDIPGTHRLGFDGPADHILLTHTARSREGFALGAIMAAEWIIGKKGFYEFADVLSEPPA